MPDEDQFDSVQVPHFTTTVVTEVEGYLDLPFILLGLAFAIVAARKCRSSGVSLLALGLSLHACKLGLMWLGLPYSPMLSLILTPLGSVGWLALAASAISFARCTQTPAVPTTP